jgi:hypothetical protein
MKLGRKDGHCTNLYKVLDLKLRKTDLGRYLTQTSNQWVPKEG